MPRTQTRKLRLGDAEVPYALVRSRRRRRTVAFAIEEGAVLTVRAPQRTTVAEIEDLAREHARWILRRLEEVREIVRPRLRAWGTGETIPYLGREVPLDVVPVLGLAASCRLRGGQMELYVPMALRQRDAGDSAVEVLTQWYRERAAERFRERADVWAQRVHVRYGRLIVTSPQQRWGSCDVNNNIRVNWRVLMAPPRIMDYVIAHELCHVVHRNHGPRFWAKLERAMPDCYERRDELRRIGPVLTL